MPLIDIAGVWKTYSPGNFAVHALRGIDFTVDDGSFVAVMGPSGSGKSTLMHIIGLPRHPDQGTYRLAGQDVSKMSELQLARIRNRRIGFVFQGYNLLPRLSAWRNVELPLVYSRRRRRPSGAGEPWPLSTSSGSSDRADHRPTELSGGQQQRVAIARAIVDQPLA